MAKEKKSSRFLGLRLFLVGVFFGVIIKLFIFDFLTVSGTSMEPTIADKSMVLVYKLAYGLVKPFGEDLIVQWNSPKVDDIVLYFYNDRAVIKRCVALEGSPLEFSSSSGYSLYVSGKRIPLTESQYQRMKHSYYVPQNMVLVVGDNYAESVDSRNYGFVPEKNILGKVLFR